MSGSNQKPGTQTSSEICSPSLSLSRCPTLSHCLPELLSFAAGFGLSSTSVEREGFFTHGLPRSLPQSGLCLATFRLNVHSSANHCGQGETLFHWPSWTTCPCLESWIPLWPIPNPDNKDSVWRKTYPKENPDAITDKKGTG